MQNIDTTLQFTARGIPQGLRPAFQEYQLEQLDLTTDANLVIERTLRYGNRAELRWLFKLYGVARVAEWVRRLGAWRLPPRHLNFWVLMLELDDYERPPERKGQLWTH